VSDLRAAILSVEPAIDPEDVRDLWPDYDVGIEFAVGQPERIDIAFRRRGGTTAPARVWRDRVAAGTPGSYANRPVRHEAGGPAVIPALRHLLREKLPEYMVPSAFVLLEALPLTPNGKIDRAALPAPERPRSESATRQPPGNEVERGIVSILQDLLGAEEVGVDDNFFDLGANSLMMVQASVRLRALLGRAVPLVRMFQFPTARALASALATGEESETAVVKQSQDRAQVRKDAMHRLRDLRRGSRDRG
jgi:acyl carrier protein